MIYPFWWLVHAALIMGAAFLGWDPAFVGLCLAMLVRLVFVIVFGGEDL